MLHLSNEFLSAIEVPADGTRPNRNTPGVAFSLGASASYGSYSQIVDGSTAWPSGCSDGYGIYLEFNVVAVSAQAHPAIATVGIDRAGGTSYTDWISHLVICDAPTTSVGTVRYYFPIRVPRGASLAVKGADAHGTPLASSYVRCTIPLNPTNPELLRLGSFVQTFGVDTATCMGVAGTSGSSEGSYVEVGTLDKPIWFWEWGVSTSSATLSNGAYVMDVALGDASNKRRVIANAWFQTGTSESIDKNTSGSFGEGAIGEKIYMRSQGSPAATAFGYAAYGVGG